MVKKDGKRGFIDKTVEEGISLGLYVSVWSFSEGLYRGKKDEKYGFINKQGVSPYPPPEF